MKYLTIKEDNVSIFMEMNENSVVTGTLNDGDIVRLLKTKVYNENIWYKIKTREGLVGYIFDVSVFKVKLVQIAEKPILHLDDDPPEVTNKKEAVLYIKPNKRLRRNTIITRKKVCWITDKFTNDDGTWYKIRFNKAEDFFLLEDTASIDENIKPRLFFRFPLILAIILLWPVWQVIQYVLALFIMDNDKPPVYLIIILILCFLWLIIGPRITKYFHTMRL